MFATAKQKGQPIVASGQTSQQSQGGLCTGNGRICLGIAA